MKTIKILLVLILIISTLGCAKNQDIQPPICKDNERLENGVCVVIDPIDPEEPDDPLDPEEPIDPEEPTDPEEPIDPEEPTDPKDPEIPLDPDLEAIKLALIETKELTNYQLTVNIEYTQDFTNYSYEITLLFAGNLAFFETENEVIYYQSTENKINQYTKQGETYLLEEVNKIQGYGFYQSLEPEWFTKINTYYLLGFQHLAEVSKLIQPNFPEGIANNFIIKLGDMYLDSYMFDVVLEEQVYHLNFTYSLFNEVEIVLPLV